MGFLSWFFVESKTFELSVVEGGGGGGGSLLRLVESSRGFSRVVLPGKENVAWLYSTAEDLVCKAEAKDLFKSIREGSKALIAQW
jgi:hypothetical protein